MRELRYGPSASCHAQGEGDEIELFIAWGGLEACQSVFRIISSAQGFSLLEANDRVVIGLMPEFLQSWEGHQKPRQLLRTTLKFRAAAGFLGRQFGLPMEQGVVRRADRSTQICLAGPTLMHMRQLPGGCDQIT